MRIAAVIIGLVLAGVAFLWIENGQRVRLYEWPGSGNAPHVLCQEGLTRTPELCLLAARQLAADEVATHPERSVDRVRIDERDGIVVCWHERPTATGAPAASPGRGCTFLSLDGAALTPAP